MCEGGGPRCNTCARRWTRACMCKHTGAIEACNEPRVTRGQPVTELIRRRGSPAHVAPACSDINLRFLRSSMDPCSVFLKKILISPPLFSLYIPVGRKMGWNRFRGFRTLPRYTRNFPRVLFNQVGEIRPPGMELSSHEKLALPFRRFPLERRFSPISSKNTTFAGAV